MLAAPIVRKLLPNPKHAGLLEFGGNYPGAWLLQRGLFLPWELDAVLDRDIVRMGLRRLSPIRHIARTLEPGPRTPFARIATLEASLYMRNQLLRDTDWAGMAHSLEIRAPLVDSTLLEQIAPLTVADGGISGKSFLATAPSKPLPDEIVSRRKTGFTTPVAAWLERNRSSRLRPYTDKESLKEPRCPWARRWAYSLAAA
jgi:asparagine synthase (glutamine-hydrolysing)